MAKRAKTIPNETLRGIEQRVERLLFGRVAARVPRYGSDPRAMAALIRRLESQGLITRLAKHGIEIDDLALRATYFYGTDALPEGERAIGALLVRSALFALSARALGARHASGPIARRAASRRRAA